jgi:hypothetical protein
MDYNIDFSTVATENDRVAVITTKPLTSEETWVEMKRGELLMFDRGSPYFHASACDKGDREGRGLCSKVSRKKRRERFQSMDSIHVPDEVCTLQNTIAGESGAQRVESFVQRVLQNH